MKSKLKELEALKKDQEKQEKALQSKTVNNRLKQAGLYANFNCVVLLA